MQGQPAGAAGEMSNLGASWRADGGEYAFEESEESEAAAAARQLSTDSPEPVVSVC